VRAAWRRPVGAHAAPRAGSRRALRALRALRIQRTRPNALSGLLLVVIAGSLGLLTVLPPAAEQQAPPTAALAASGEPAAEAPSAPVEDDLVRASRSRARTQVALAAQAAAPPVAVPPPPPPPPPPIPGCDGKKPDLRRYPNGRLPDSALCRVPGSTESLRADAAVAFVRLAQAYEKHFGTPICLTDGYRTLAEQKAVRRVKPRLAARPGTSEHGWGVAADLACGVQSFRSAQHAWMVQNAETYGWYLPRWARRGGSKPEPWHWEYIDK
jgi:hypothetical protein